MGLRSHIPGLNNNNTNNTSFSVVVVVLFVGVVGVVVVLFVGVVGVVLFVGVVGVVVVCTWVPQSMGTPVCGRPEYRDPPKHSTQCLDFPYGIAFPMYLDVCIYIYIYVNIYIYVYIYIPTPTHYLDAWEHSDMDMGVHGGVPMSM
jgi:hypothetical protein